MSRRTPARTARPSTDRRTFQPGNALPTSRKRWGCRVSARIIRSTGSTNQGSTGSKTLLAATLVPEPDRPGRRRRVLAARRKHRCGPDQLDS